MGIFKRPIKIIIGNRIVEVDQLHPIGVFEKLYPFIVDMLCDYHLFSHGSA